MHQPPVYLVTMPGMTGQPWSLVRHRMSTEEREAHEALGHLVERVLYCRHACGFATTDMELLVHHEDSHGRPHL